MRASNNSTKLISRVIESNQSAARRRYYTLCAVDEQGAPGCEWQSSATWPPGDTQPLVVHFGGEASMFQPSPSALHAAGFRNFTFDPSNPSPTIGGVNLDPSLGWQPPPPPASLTHAVCCCRCGPLRSARHCRTTRRAIVRAPSLPPLFFCNILRSYTTSALPKPMVITGPVTASIMLALDQPDADIVLRLCDVYATHPTPSSTVFL